MVKLIPGRKGSGKTKVLINAIHEAGKKSDGNVVAIQLGSSLNANVYHKIRLINIEDYNVNSYDDMYGFVTGLMASDYDCTHIFTDGLLRIAGRDLEKIGEMLDRIDKVSDSTCVTFTISADVNDLPDSMKKYL